MKFGAVFLGLLPALASAAIIREEYQSIEDPCERYIQRLLIHADCSNRGLSEIPAYLENDVQILILSNNKFYAIPAQLENFTNLEVLDLSSNKLNQQLPAYIENLTKLHTLNLSNNYYETWLSSEHTSSIKVLDLSNNKINQVEEEAFDSMPNLRSIDLTENKIDNLPPRVFDNLSNLSTLNLSKNNLDDVPEINSTSLRILNLSNCKIIYFNIDSLAGLHSILNLDLSYNQLEYIPDGFESQTLQELILNHNNLYTLSDKSFSTLPHLAVLDLRGNYFSKIWSSTLFASNLFLREIHVSGNRWNCEGFGVNLLLTFEYLTREPSKVSDESTLICFSPSNVTQLTWQQAYIRTWHSNDSSIGSFTMVAVMIGFILGIIITSVICRGLMSANRDDAIRVPQTDVTIVNVNDVSQSARVDTVVMRIPLRDEDLPPTYDEALLMPRLNTSFHSLPDFIDEEEPMRHSRRYRRSRSFSDLTETRTRISDRTSMRRMYARNT